MCRFPHLCRHFSRTVRQPHRWRPSLDVGWGTGSLTFTMRKITEVAGITSIDLTDPYVVALARASFQSADACVMLSFSTLMSRIMVPTFQKSETSADNVKGGRLS